MKKRRKLTAAERDRIAHFLASGETISEIGRKLGRSKGTVSEEVKRNKHWDDARGCFVYEAIFAQEETQERMIKRRRRPTLKNDWIYQYVMGHIRCGWSPEQIEGRLKLEHAGQYHRNIGHEAIYQYIYSKENKEEKLWEYLPRKQKKRKKQRGRTVHKSHISGRISISQRSDAVNKREVFGHWEGDTIEGKRSVGDGIRTEVERLSRLVLAKKVKGITSEDAINAQLHMFSQLPGYARQSETMDNGREHHKHIILKQELGMKTYFCHPYSSWERGTNENTNGLVRRYFPKGTDFRTIDEEELEMVLYELNTRPKKILGYHTPLEVFTSHLVNRSDSR